MSKFTRVSLFGKGVVMWGVARGRLRAARAIMSGVMVGVAVFGLSGLLHWVPPTRSQVVVPTGRRQFWMAIDPGIPEFGRVVFSSHKVKAISQPTSCPPLGALGEFRPQAIVVVVSYRGLVGAFPARP
ncbi:MAG: hypothetical protein ACRCTR_02975 [Actinomycetota bacterium]